MRTFAVSILILITFIWGSTFIVVKDAIQFIPPFLFVSLRFLIASILLIPFIFTGKNLSVFEKSSNTGPGWKRENGFFISSIKRSPDSVKNTDVKRNILTAVLVGTALFGGYVFQTLGLLYTTATKSAFITSLSVVLVPFVSFALFKSRPGIREIVALLLAFVGLYQLILGPHFKFNGINKGDWLTFLCALSFAFHISLTGFFTKSIDLRIFTFSQFLYVSIVAFIFSRLFSEPIAGLEGNPLYALLFIGVFATAFAFVGQTWAQRHLRDVHTALIFSLEPVFATIFGVAIGGEILTISQVIGGIMILLGIVISQF